MHRVHSFIVHNDCDSFTVNLMGHGEFIRTLIYHLGGDYDYDFYQMLRQKVPISTAQWEWIANAVKHELTETLGNLVRFTSSSLPLWRETSGDDLLSVIKNKILLSENKYLRHLIDRNRSRNEMGIPLENPC